LYHKKGFVFLVELNHIGILKR